MRDALAAGPGHEADVVVARPPVADGEPAQQVALVRAVVQGADPATAVQGHRQQAFNED